MLGVKIRNTLSYLAPNALSELNVEAQWFRLRDDSAKPGVIYLGEP